MDLEAIMRRACRLDGLQACEATDAVIDMHDQIARCEACCLGDEILRPSGRTAGANEPVAKDILFADDRTVFCLKAGFDPQHGERHRKFRKRKRLWPTVDGLKIVEFVSGQHMAQAIKGAPDP